MSNRVAITRVKDCDFDAAVRQALELAGGFMDLIRPDSRVVVKPNLARRAPSGSGAVTDARVTEAVTKAVLDLRPASVTIAEGAPAGYDDASLSTEEVFRLSGTDAVAQRLGRKSIGIEIDEEYFKIGLRRLGIQITYKGEVLRPPDKSFTRKRSRTCRQASLFEKE